MNESCKGKNISNWLMIILPVHKASSRRVASNLPERFRQNFSAGTFRKFENFVVLKQTQKVFFHKYLNFNTIFMARWGKGNCENFLLHKTPKLHSSLMLKFPRFPQLNEIFLCSFFFTAWSIYKKHEISFRFFLLSNSCF